jgi:hypothetical protein
MTNSWTKLLVGLAAAVMVAGAPAIVRAAGCGDLNNDGTLTASDCLALAQCLSGGGTCPAVSPGPLCGTGSLAACGDMFGDGNVTLAGLAADLSVCNDTVATLPTLYDKCHGPGANIACPGGNVSLGSQTITTSQTWPASCKVTITGTVFVAFRPVRIRSHR